MALHSTPSVVLEAQSATKSILNVFKNHKNIAKDVQETVKDGVQKLLSIIEVMAEELDQKRQQTDNSALAAIFEHKIQACFEQNKEISKDIKDLKTSINAKTYSSVVKHPGQSQLVSHSPPPKLFPVILSPKDVNTHHSCKANEKTIKEIVINNNKNENKKIRINGCKYVGKGGLVVNCLSTEDCKHLVEKMEANNDFTAKMPAKRFPRIVVKGVDESIEEGEVINELVTKNSEINEYFVNNQNEAVDQNIKLKFKFRRNQTTNGSNGANGPNGLNGQNGPNVTTNDKTNTWVLEVSPKIWQIIKNRRSLHFGWTACRFNEYLYIKRCYRCQRFGHISTECKDSASGEVCGGCAGGHTTKGCTATKQCINCCRFNAQNPTKRQLSTNHSVFSNDCECLQRLKEKLMQNISYNV